MKSTNLEIIVGVKDSSKKTTKTAEVAKKW
jgi:hypothetical protein